VQRISARTTQTHANPQRENKTAKKKFNASFSAACKAPVYFRPSTARLKSGPDTKRLRSGVFRSL
ncbi:MAG: hypothetical protein ACYCSP_08020, partial [Acidobacteriaceae bacterium]